MANFCPHCGARVNEDDKVCLSCGGSLSNSENNQENGNNNTGQQYYNNGQYYDPYGNYRPPYNVPYGNGYGNIPTREMNIGMLIFSIINIVFGGRIFGLIALVFTISARSKPTAELEANNLKIAKILNIIGVVCAVISSIAVYFIVLWLLENGYDFGFEYGEEFARYLFKMLR